MFSHKNSQRIEYLFYACYIVLPSVPFIYRFLTYEQVILSAVYMNQRRMVPLFFNNKIEEIWMKESCSKFRRSFCLKISKFSHYSGTVPMFQLGFSLLQTQNIQIGTFVFLFFVLPRSIESTGQKELRQLRNLRRVD